MNNISNLQISLKNNIIQNMEKYQTNKHSIFLLQYSLILVIKYRKKLLNNEINLRLKEIFERIAPTYKIKLINISHDNDHVHLVFQSEPKTELSKFINAYKSASSRLIKKEFPQIKEKLWQSAFWSRSFFLATTGGVTLETLKKYVENQGNNDR